MRNIKTPQDRLLSRRTISTSGCWEWITASNVNKHTTMTVNVGPNVNVVDYVHRVAYATWKGKIPEGLNVCHTCDNPRCFNPDHLFVGTDMDNVKDKMGKNRLPQHEDHYASKLTEAMVTDLRNGCVSISDIADATGCSKSHLYRIRKGVHWPGVK